MPARAQVSTPQQPDTPVSSLDILQKYLLSDEVFTITTEKGVAGVEQMVQDFITYNIQDELYEAITGMMDILDKEGVDFSEKKPEVYKRLKRLIAKGQWFLLDRFPPSTVEMLFREYFEYFFDYEWKEVENKTRIVLLYEPSLKQRDVHKKKWREAIAQSNALMSDAPIVVNGQEVDATVKNWIRDFQLFLNERPISPLFIIEYLNNNETAKSVDAETRKKIEGLLQFIEILHRSSLTPEGTEEAFLFGDPVSGHYYFFDRGEVDDTGVEIDKDELKSLREIYNLDENGKPKPFVEAIQSSPVLFPEVVTSRYQSPQTVKEKVTEAKELPTVMEMPAPKQEMPQPAHTEEKTVVEPIIEDEALVPPPPLEPEIPTMQIAPSPPAPATTAETPAAPEPEEPVPAPTPVQQNNLDYNVIAKQVLGELKLLLPSLEMEKRFLSVVASYLRGVRDKMELAESLRQTEQEGGVNLSKEQVELVQQACDTALKQAQQHPQKGATTQEATGPILKPTLEMVQERMKEQQKVEDATTGDKNEDPTSQIEDIFSNVQPTFDGPVIQASSSTVPTTQRVQSPKKSTPLSSSPRMMNPIDELRNMNLTEFRKLAATPQEAAQKIMDKIELLAEESLPKKADGISAWKASPLHALYVSIGNTSLEAGKSIDAIILQMQQEGKDTLTQEEFSAIADVNQKMRF